jgi:transposase InsO family protein
LRRPIEFAQYTSFDYTQQLDDAKVVASVGSVGDAYDNAMAESLVDSYKTELIRDRVWPNPHPARARHDRMGRLLQHVMPRSA